jgi:hypothetical protein
MNDLAHADFPPSGAHRWLDKCPASARIAKTAPKQPDSPESIEGTRMHDVIHRALTRGEYPNEPEDARAVSLIEDFIDKLGEGVELFEERVDMIAGIVWGRLDYAHGAARVATLVDYKNGAWDVNATYGDGEHNEQLLSYADGVRMQMGDDKFDWYRLVIVQPNSRTQGETAPIKQVVVPANTVRAHHQRIVAAVERSKHEAPRPGPHCRYCPAFGTCTASLDIFSLVTNSLAMPVNQIPNDAIVAVLRVLRGLADYKKVLDAELAKRMLVPGREPPKGVQMGMTASHRKWKDEFLATKLLWEAYGALGVKPLSPAQAEQLGPQGVEVVAAMAFQPPGRMTPKY